MLAFFHKILTYVSLSAVATSDTYRVACHKYQPHWRPTHPSPHAPQQRVESSNWLRQRHEQLTKAKTPWPQAGHKIPDTNCSCSCSWGCSCWCCCCCYCCCFCCFSYCCCCKCKATAKRHLFGLVCNLLPMKRWRQHYCQPSSLGLPHHTRHKWSVFWCPVSTTEQSLQKFMARRSSLFVNLCTYVCVSVCVCMYCGSLCSDTPYLAVIPHRASLIPSRLPSSTPAVPGTDGHASGTAIRMHAGTHTHTHSS